MTIVCKSHANVQVDPDREQHFYSLLCGVESCFTMYKIYMLKNIHMTLTCHFDNIECVVMMLRASMEHELTMVYIIIKLYLHVFVTHTPTR